MNSITLVGYAGRDAEMTYTPSGTAITKFSIADSQKRNGEETTTWYNIALFGKTGETAALYVKKGTQVLIIGTLTMHPFTDKTGVARTSYDVAANTLQLLGRKGDNGETSETGGPDSRPPTRPAGSPPAPLEEPGDFPF